MPKGKRYCELSSAALLATARASVVTIFLNAEAFLPDAIESV